MSKYVAIAIIAILGVAAVIAGCSGKPESKEKPRPNIVIILVDALRSDHVSAYGYERKTTPSLDANAENGLLFENMIAQAPWTLPSLASMFTSLYPSEVVKTAKSDLDEINRKEGREKYFMLGKSANTLAEALKGNGYRTMSVFIGAFPSKHFGMSQGIDDEVSLTVENRADAVVDKSIEVLKRYRENTPDMGEHPFYMLLHVVDVHEPLNPPQPYDTMYPTIDNMPHEERHKKWAYLSPGKVGTGEFNIYKSHRVALYDGALNFVDSQIARFEKYLKEEGMYDNTVFVIMADHGEEMWDHARYEKDVFYPRKASRYGFGHGHTMFNELLRIPFVMYGPGVPKGRVKQQVRAIDMMPTILGLAGIDTAGMKFEGVDLIARLRDGSLKDMLAYSESPDFEFDMRAIQDARYKYIRIEGREFLYDKKADPFEMNDISKEQAEVTERFSKAMDALIGGFRSVAKGEPVEMNEEVKKQLKALGYIQ